MKTENKNSITASIETFQANQLADMQSKVTKIGDFVSLIEHHQSQSKALYASLVLSALNSIRLHGDLAGLGAVLNLAVRYKYDIKGFKQWVNEIGLAQAIIKDKDTGTYSFKKGFKAGFFTSYIENKLLSFDLDITKKLLFTFETIDNLFWYEEVSEEKSNLSKDEVILKLSATIAALMKHQDINLDDFNKALILSKYEAKERKNLLGGGKVEQKTIDRPSLEMPAYDPSLESAA